MKTTVTGTLHAVETWITENPKMSAVIGAWGVGQLSPDTVKMLTAWANKIVTMAGGLLL